MREVRGAGCGAKAIEKQGSGNWIPEPSSARMRLWRSSRSAPTAAELACRGGELSRFGRRSDG